MATGRQSQRFSYRVIDEDTGVEVIGVEVRRGLMKPEACIKDESVLLPTMVGILQQAQAEAQAKLSA